MPERKSEHLNEREKGGRMNMYNEKELKKMSDKNLLSEYQSMIAEVERQSNLKQTSSRLENISKLKSYKAMLEATILARMNV